MPAAPPTATPTSPRVAGFLVAEALSAIGSWATIVAIWGYAAFEYDASPGEVSLFGIAFAAPGLLLGPLTGAVVDRIGPKATLALAKVIGVVASLALLAADDFRTLALLSVLHGTASAFSHPALQSMPPRLVDDVHLARTNALVSLTDELAIVLGPVAAGVGIAAFGFRGAFVFDALTYGLGLAVLPVVQLRAIRAGTHPDADPPVRLRDALAGWQLIVRTGVLRRTVGCTFVVHLLYGTALLAEPLYVRDVLERSPSTFAAPADGVRDLPRRGGPGGRPPRRPVGQLRLGRLRCRRVGRHCRDLPGHADLGRGLPGGGPVGRGHGDHLGAVAHAPAAGHP